MPVGKTLAPRTVPPEIVRARMRLSRALSTIASMPIPGAANINVQKLLDEADRAAFNRPDRWDKILEFQAKAEEQVRAFPMPQRPTWADVDKAVAILEDFMYRSIIDVGGGTHVTAGIVTGWISGPLHSDMTLRAQLPIIYTRVRMNLLGMM